LLGYVKNSKLQFEFVVSNANEVHIMWQRCRLISLTDRTAVARDAYVHVGEVGDHASIILAIRNHPTSNLSHDQRLMGGAPSVRTVPGIVNLVQERVRSVA